MIIMKVIFSRKGFDSTYGGIPSPILPSVGCMKGFEADRDEQGGEKLLSMPIPNENDSDCYAKLHKDGISYADLIRDLAPRKNALPDMKCHLDPDLYVEVKDHPAKWRPAFGQCDAALTHLLETEKVNINDLFLFFGWFRQTEYINGRYRFVRNAPGRHIIYGYLQIGKIYCRAEDVPNGLREHPHMHLNWSNDKKTINAIFAASDQLSFLKQYPGAGVFHYAPELVLTKTGLSRSKWDLPEIFRGVKISYHSDSSWKKDYFQSAAIGQEFVWECNPVTENWVKERIKAGLRNSHETWHHRKPDNLGV